MLRNRHLLNGLLSAFAAAIVICLVIPAQSFAANMDDFSFGWLKLLQICLPSFIAVLVILSIVCAMSARRGLVWPCVASIAAAFAVLVEVGPLSIGLPEVDGRMSAFKNNFRQCWDLSVWVFVIAIPLFYRHVIYRYIHIIVPLFVLYSLATIADSGKCRYFDGEFSKTDGYLVPKMYQQADVVHSIRYSPRRNIFLLVVDSMSADIAASSLNANPDIISKFPGFVLYEDNAGMDWPTRSAIPAIFTGKLREPKDDLNAYSHAYIRAGSFLEPYLLSDCPVFMNLDIGFGGFTNRRIESLQSRQRNRQRMTGALSWSIGEISIFRSLPYVLKRHYLRYVTNYWETLGLDHWFAGDRNMWPMLAECPVEENWECTLQVHHTWGIHSPVTFDRYGNTIKVGLDDARQIYVDGASFVLGLIGNFFDSLRARGLYDSATILLIADHGIDDGDRRAFGLPDDRAYPMLMVKPANATEALSFSKSRTSHAGIASVMRALAERDLSGKEIEKLLVDAPRKIRHYERGKVKEWSLDE